MQNQIDEGFDVYETFDKNDKKFQEISSRLMGAELVFEINYDEQKNKFK